MTLKSVLLAAMVCLFGIAGRVVLAGPVTSAESFNFDNNQLPAGWTTYQIPGAPAGGSVLVTNNRLEFGSSITQGGIYRPIDTVGLAQVQVTYDASVPRNSGPSTFLLNDAWFSNSPASRVTGGSVQAGIGNLNAGFNSSIIFGAPGQTIQYYENKFFSVPSGVANEFRITNSFQDGLVTQSVLDIASGTTFLNSQVAVAGFKLTDMQKLFLYDSTASGVTGWIDNVQITTTAKLPTCTPPQLLQGNACVTPPPPTCTPPQVLQGNACVTPPPPTCTLPQVLQGNVCVTPPPPTCTSPQVLQNGVCTTPTQAGNNIFLNESAKLFYRIYEDLWKDVGVQLKYIGYGVTTLAGSTLAKVEMVSTMVAEYFLGQQIKSTVDPRDDYNLVLAKGLNTFRKTVRAIGELGLADTPSKFELAQLKVALGLAKLTASTLESLAHELANDPPRDDYAVVRMPNPPADFAAMNGATPTTPLEITATAIANCSINATDGLQVALLAAERAWGASIAKNDLAFSQQNAAYAAGVSKANAATKSCEQAFIVLKQQLIDAGMPNYDASALPTNTVLSVEVVEVIRQTLLEISTYTQTEFDTAFAEALAQSSAPIVGSIFDRMNDLESSFAAIESIDSNLSVPEPKSWMLVCLALFIMYMISNRNRRLFHYRKFYCRA